MTEAEAYYRRSEINAGEAFPLKCTKTGTSNGAGYAAFNLASGRYVMIVQPSCMDIPFGDRHADVKKGDIVPIFCTGMEANDEKREVWYWFTALLSSFRISGADTFALKGE